MGNKVKGRDEKYRRWCHEQNCVVCGSTPCQAAHLRMWIPYKDKGGMGSKPDDKWCFPLCPSCHGAQHNMGEPRFWAELGFTEEQAVEMVRNVRRKYEWEMKK